MIDEETAAQGLEALAVAISSLLEDADPIATGRPKTLAGYADVAGQLLSAGQDITALAQAMEVLTRHREGVA